MSCFVSYVLQDAEGLWKRQAIEGDKNKAKGGTEGSAFWKSELEARYRSGSDATPFQIRFNQR